MASKAGPRPVPGGWYGSDLAADPESWRVALPGDVRDELFRAAAAFAPGGIGADPHQRRPAVSERTRALVADLHRRLADEPGVVVLTGFPTQEEPELTERTYLVLGMLLGQPVLQTLDGRLLTRVEALDPNVKTPGAQKIGIPNALPFHVDRATDLIGLLCLRQARAGGRSLLVSAKMVHNILMERRPDLLSVLYEPVPIHVPPLKGPAGDLPPRWCEAPVFSRIDDGFASYCDRYIIEQTQRFPDAPRLTRRQVAALDAVDEVFDTPRLRLEMALEPGDLQLINNLTLLHSRTSYDDRPNGQGRLLLRLHLAFGGSPALPDGFAAVYGATAPGTYRGGLWRTPAVQHRFGVSLAEHGAMLT
jgi:Taurine catabolism dioxygenase TauD, TfdA family